MEGRANALEAGALAVVEEGALAVLDEDFLALLKGSLHMSARCNYARSISEGRTSEMLTVLE